MEDQIQSPLKSKLDIKNLTKKQKIIIATSVLFIVIGIVIALTSQGEEYCHCKIDGTIWTDQGCPENCQCKDHVRGEFCQMCEKGFTGYPKCDKACQDDPQIVTDAKKNDIYAVKKQIEEGACVDSLAAKRLFKGYTALAEAVYNKNEEMVNLLLQHGASVNARGSAANKTPLMIAAMNGDLQMVKRLVEDYHADPSLRINAALSITTYYDGWTACIYAKKNNKEEVVQYFKDNNYASTCLYFESILDLLNETQE